MKYLLLAILIWSTLFLSAQNNKNIDSCTVLQPGFERGYDAEIFSCNTCGYDTTNYGTIQDICATAWTNSGDTSLVRSLFYFDLSFIPSNFIVTSAKLTLYHNPSSPEGQHASLSGPNSSVLQRITTSWGENTVTWNTQPQTTTVNQVLIPSTTSSTQNFIDIDVTQLVSDMVNNPTSSFGFLFKQQTEQFYRKLVFASSDHPVDSLHPKLEVCIQSTVGVNLSIDNNSFRIYPNPSKDKITIEYNQLKAEQVQIKLYSMEGRVLMEKTLLSNKMQIDVSDFSKGVYIVQVQSDKSGIARQKFVINR
jgi:hypothetical protein